MLLESIHIYNLLVQFFLWPYFDIGIDDCFGSGTLTGPVNDRAEKQLRAGALRVMIVLEAVSDDVVVTGHVMVALATVPPIDTAHMTAPHVIGQLSCRHRRVTQYAQQWTVSASRSHFLQWLCNPITQ